MSTATVQSTTMDSQRVRLDSGKFATRRVTNVFRDSFGTLRGEVRLNGDIQSVSKIPHSRTWELV